MRSPRTRVGPLDSLGECSRMFSCLPQESIVRLGAGAVSRVFRKSEMIFAEGDTVPSYYLLVDGRVRVFKQTAAGRYLTILLLQSGDTLGEFALFSDSRLCVSAQALEDSLVLELNKADVLALAREDHVFARRIVGTMGDRAKALADRMLDMVSNRAEGRVIKILGKLFRETGGVVPLNHQEVADIAGTSRETVSRIMSRLQDSGALRCLRGGFVLIDRAVDATSSGDVE